MKPNITFKRTQDENGYATFYPDSGDRPAEFGRNPLLRGIEIQEWTTPGSNGFFTHYYLRDRKDERSVWKHSLKLETFDSLDECKKDLLVKITEYLRELVL